MPECSLVPKSYSFISLLFGTIEFNPYLPLKFLVLVLVLVLING